MTTKPPGFQAGKPLTSISSALSMEGPEIGTLVLVVDRARNLPNMQTVGKQDPYCVARLGNETKMTVGDIRGGQTLKWDMEIRFKVHDSPNYYQLKLSIFRDGKKTELISETWIDLREIIIPGGGQNDQWYTLEYDGKYAGEIRTEITYYDNRPKHNDSTLSSSPLSYTPKQDRPSPRDITRRRQGQHLSFFEESSSFNHSTTVNPKSALLAEFRAISKPLERYELKDIYGHIVEFSGDQHGSRFIQQKLETASTKDKEQVFLEIQPDAFQLMQDVFGSYVIQKLFEYGSQPQKAFLTLEMVGRIAQLSLQMYGTRVVQKALEHVSVEQQHQIVQELHPCLEQVIKDQNGNHVVQKAISLLPDVCIPLISNRFRGRIRVLATHSYGVRVIQGMLEHGNVPQQQELTGELRPYIAQLITDQYGNYVIQHIVAHGQPDARSTVVRYVIGDLVVLSQHKFASCVVERCIQYATPEELTNLKSQFVNPGSATGSPLRTLMDNQYGSYVIRKLIQHIGSDRDDFYSELQRQATVLSTSKPGSKSTALWITLLRRHYHSDMSIPTRSDSMTSPSTLSSPQFTPVNTMIKAKTVPASFDQKEDVSIQQIDAKSMFAKDTSKNKGVEKEATIAHEDQKESQKLESLTLQAHILPDIHPNALQQDWKSVLANINEDIRWDIRFDKAALPDGGDSGCWTCTPSSSLSPDRVPLKIARIPVVIPVEYQYQLTAASSPPPDPHPRFISPTETLSNDTVEQIFLHYEEAVGFYLLINGFLQLIVPADFDCEYAVSHKPNEFGGLKVSYIHHQPVPTAGGPSSVAASSTEVRESVITSTSSKPAAAEATLEPQREHSRRNVTPLAGELSIGSSIRVSVKNGKTKDRFEAKLGLRTTSNGRYFVTVPTHIISDACGSSKVESWSQVKVLASNGNVDLGTISETFDPSAQTFPVGFAHDVSLVDVSSLPLSVVSGIRSPMQTEWLSTQGWAKIQYNTQELFLLDDRVREAKSIGVLPSQCQMVGQGIFRIYQKSKTRSFRESVLRLKQKDARDDLDTWSDLVARSVLYRVHPEFTVRGGQSGTPVCVLNSSEDGTQCAQVAGFASFVQMVSDVQRYDMEGDQLDKRLHEGRVAFYGAFRAPEKLRNTHEIM